MNALVLRSAIVAALGGLLFGFDTAVISGTTQDLERVYQISGFTLGFTVATALIGTVVGALIVAILRSGLTQMGIDSNYQNLATGVLVIAAVAFDQATRRRA